MKVPKVKATLKTIRTADVNASTTSVFLNQVNGSPQGEQNFCRGEPTKRGE